MFTDFDSFISKPNAVRKFGNWIAELSPIQSDGSPLSIPGQSDGVIRVTSRAEGYRSDRPSRHQYLNRLRRGLQLKSSLWSSSSSFSIGGTSIAPRAELSIVNTDGLYDEFSPANGILWDGRPCTVRFGSGFGFPGQKPYLPYEEFRTFNFVMGEPTFSLGRVVVPLHGQEKIFDNPLTNLVYRGTGYTLDFAAGAYADHGKPGKWDLTGSMTYEGWHNVDNLTSNRAISGWRGGTQQSWNCSVTSTGAIRFAYTHSGGTSAFHVSSAGLVVAGRWYHIAIIVDGTTGLFVVYDGLTGNEVVESFTTATSTRDGQSGASSNFQTSLNNEIFSWVGRLDDQRIWDVARTLSEIRDNRNIEIDIVPANLVGYLKHNDSSGGTTSDSASSPSNGTLNGATAWYHSCEGSSSLSGRTKPDPWGSTEHQTCVLVDEANQIYQVASQGEIQSLQPHEGLTNITSGGSDIADEKTFISVTVAAGEFRTHLASGKFKLGSVPTLPVTASINGYIDGGYVDQKADIIRRIVTSRGPDPLDDPGDLDTASFSALNSADNSTHGIMISDTTTIREVLDLVAGPGVWWGFPIDSDKFTVSQWTGVGSVADHTIPSSRILDISPIDDPIRFWRVLIKFNLLKVHSETEINPSLKTTNPTLYQRALKGYVEALSEKSSVFDDHHQAKSVEWYSAYQLTKSVVSAGGLPEASRILDMLSRGWAPYKLVVDPVGLKFKLGETIAPKVKIGDNYRLGFNGSRLLSILGIDIDPATWQVSVVAVG